MFDRYALAGWYDTHGAAQDAADRIDPQYKPKVAPLLTGRRGPLRFRVTVLRTYMGYRH